MKRRDVVEKAAVALEGPAIEAESVRATLVRSREAMLKTWNLLCSRRVEVKTVQCSDLVRIDRGEEAAAWDVCECGTQSKEW